MWSALVLFCHVMTITVISAAVRETRERTVPEEHYIGVGHK